MQSSTDTNIPKKPGYTWFYRNMGSRNIFYSQTEPCQLLNIHSSFISILYGYYAENIYWFQAMV